MASEGDADAIVDAIRRFAVADWVHTPEHPAERWLASAVHRHRGLDGVRRQTRRPRLAGCAAAVSRHRPPATRSLLGREIDTAGDGLFATFDGPARAIRCAAALAGEVKSLGILVRAGLHTGEVETSGDKVSGLAVHIGARVMGHAAAREVLVSSTVKDLVAGSGISFEERGTHTLKGVPGEWQVFRAIVD